MTDTSKEAFAYQCECNLSYVSNSDKVTVEIGQQHLKDMFDKQSARIAELESREVTVHEAAKVLLGEWLEGNFENTADAEADDAFEAGNDSTAIIETWIRALSSEQPIIAQEDGQ